MDQKRMAAIGSYIFTLLATVAVFKFHLLSAVLAGLAVHVLTLRLARQLPKTLTRVARGFALSCIMTTVILAVAGGGFSLWLFLQGDDGLAAMAVAAVKILEDIRAFLPSELARLIPETLGGIQGQVVEAAKTHVQKISSVGLSGIRALTHLVIGMVIGGMTSLHVFDEAGQWPPFASSLHARLQRLAQAFEKVVFAQVRISAVNTVLTGIYLGIVLPLMGVDLPFVSIVIVFTFVAGLIPIAGNLISNTVIVLLSLGASPIIATSSLAFLVCIHKLEYFINARIVGSRVHARAWELLCAMMVMEAMFGIGGLVAAPILYAWVKDELSSWGMI